jgi:ATP-dependent RNA helicase DDX56/DBP9
MSATFNENILKLKKLMLHNPVILNLKELNEKETNLSEFYTFAKEEEKFLYLFGFFKLRLIKGKV